MSIYIFSTHFRSLGHQTIVSSWQCFLNRFIEKALLSYAKNRFIRQEKWGVFECLLSYNIADIDVSNNVALNNIFIP
jgi:hypothetical protein